MDYTNATVQSPSRLRHWRLAVQLLASGLGLATVVFFSSRARIAPTPEVLSTNAQEAHLEWSVGEWGQGCHEACHSLGMSCDVSEFPVGEAAARQIAESIGIDCARWLGEDSPRAPDENIDSICKYNFHNGDSDCGTKVNTGFRRFCPCRRFVLWTVSAVGQSCDEACASNDLTCSSSSFPHGEAATQVIAEKLGIDCTEWLGEDSPRAPDESIYGLCKYNYHNGDSECSIKVNAQFRRLCPCVM